MDKKTYEALKMLIDFLKVRAPSITESNEENIKIMTAVYGVKGWIDEVAKEYID